jgi:hypothetical protein
MAYKEAMEHQEKTKKKLTEKDRFEAYRKRIERWLSADAREKLFHGHGAAKTRLYVMSLTREDYERNKPPK